jgi:putative peptide zinc metalloprotease protein
MNPKRIQDVELKRFDKDKDEDEVYYILRDEKTGEYYRFAEPEAFIWNLLDGEHSIDDILNEVCDKFGNLTGEGLESFLAELKGNQLIEGFVPSHIPEEKRLTKITNVFSKLLSLKLPLVHPDRFCGSLYKRIGWLFSRWMILPYSILTVMGVALFLINYSTIAGEETIRIYDSGFIGIFLLFALLIVFGVVHEFCHALACKKFGRRVGDMGVMLYLIAPYLYCDTSDAWFCENKWERAFVSLSGPIFTVLISCVFVLIWCFVPLSPFIHLTVQRFIYFSFLSVLFCFNPLILVDGYYAFMDLVDVPNLRSDSFKFIKNVFLRFFKRERIDPMDYTKKERFAYMAYGGMAAAVTFGILIYATSIYYVIWDTISSLFS